jgi:hypothetical protein
MSGGDIDSEVGVIAQQVNFGYKAIGKKNLQSKLRKQLSL